MPYGIHARGLIVALALWGACTGTVTLAAPAGAAPTWTPPQLIIDPIGETHDPQVVVAPDGTASAIWFRQTSHLFQVESSMRRAGEPWGNPVLLSQASHNGTQARIAVAPDGTATAVWRRNDGYVLQIESTTRSPDGTWGPPALISSAADAHMPGMQVVGATDPQVAVAADGTATATWTRLVGEHFVVEAATRSPGGPWQTPARLSDPALEAQTPQIAVTPNGTATIVWSSYDGVTYRAMSATRPAGAAGWDTATVLSPASAVQTYPQIAVAPDGTTGVAWWYYPSGSFSVDIPFQAMGAVRAPDEPWGAATSLSGLDGFADPPQIAVDSTGTLTVVWRRGGQLDGQFEAISRPPGGPWGTPEVISAGQDISRTLEVAVAPDGTAFAAWAHTVDGRSRAAVVTRPPGGTWSSPTDISDPNEIAYGVDIVATPGAVTATWRHHSGSIVSSVLDDTPPSIDDLVVPATGTAGQPVAFSVTATDLWSALGTTGWSFGDDATGTGTETTHTYSAPGTYTVTVTARDEHGNEATESRDIVITPAPAPPPSPEADEGSEDALPNPSDTAELPASPVVSPPIEILPAVVVPAPVAPAPATTSPCPIRGLTLLTITPAGATRAPKARVTGYADRSFAGRTATILRNDRPVAATKIRPDGTISAEILAPRDRSSRDRARYRLRLDHHRTRAFRATRRVRITHEARLANGAVRVRGQIVGARTSRTLSVQSQSTCRSGPRGRATIVRTDARGRFALTLQPAPNQTLRYRVRTHDTITLPILVVGR